MAEKVNTNSDYNMAHMVVVARLVRNAACVRNRLLLERDWQSFPEAAAAPAAASAVGECPR
jgi:hypothetical protein